MARRGSGSSREGMANDARPEELHRSPREEVMTRDGTAKGDQAEQDADPVRRLEEMPAEELERAQAMNSAELADFFEGLGLRELPRKVVEQELNGSILHAVSKDGVKSMRFERLGEAIAFEDFCARMKKTQRSSQRHILILKRRMPYNELVHEWNEGPCSICNRWSMRSYRTGPEQVLDCLCCSPKLLHELPEPTVTVFQDHVLIARARWSDQMPAKYHKLTRGFAPPNVIPYVVTEDNVDVSLIFDIDADEKPKVETYTRTSADIWHYVRCQSLRRDPFRGDFYWVSLCRRCCGYERHYHEVPDGIVKLKVRQPGIRVRSEEPAEKVFGIIDDSQSLTRAIIDAVEDSRRSADLDSA